MSGAVSECAYATNGCYHIWNKKGECVVCGYTKQEHNEDLKDLFPEFYPAENGS